MLGGLLAELRKLRRPLLLWLTLGTVALVVLFAAMSQQPNYEYIGNLRQGEVNMRLHPPTASELGVQPGPSYDAALAKEYRSMHRQTEEAIAHAVAVGSTQHPAGALGLAARLMASSLGALVILLLAGGHTGAEWTQRTIKDVLARDPRRYRFVLLKIASLWAAGSGSSSPPGSASSCSGSSRDISGRCPSHPPRRRRGFGPLARCFAPCRCFSCTPPWACASVSSFATRWERCSED